MICKRITTATSPFIEINKGTMYNAIWLDQTRTSVRQCPEPGAQPSEAGPGRDSRRRRGKLAVQCRERRRGQGSVKHEQPYQAHTKRRVASRWYLHEIRVRGTSVDAMTTYK